MNNQGTIKRSSNGAAAVTVFNGTVYNRSAGKIEAGIYGIYNETVENNGTIIGGTFYGAVTIQKGILGLGEDWKHQRRHILRSNRK